MRSVLVGLGIALCGAAIPPAVAAEISPYVSRDSAAPCLKVRFEPTAAFDSDACLPPGTRVAGIEGSGRYEGRDIAINGNPA